MYWWPQEMTVFDVKDTAVPQICELTEWTGKPGMLQSMGPQRVEHD